MTAGVRYCVRCFGRDAGTVGLHIVENGTPDGEAACGYHAIQALKFGKTLRAAADDGKVTP
jgi:hypothetical protein